MMRKWLVEGRGQRADLHRYSYLMRKWLVKGRSSQVQLFDEGRD